jgi:raffinose/stachyose/melibiose transport system substrate-binding protein
MKKLVALVLALALVLTATAALADIVICQNKVEIGSIMEEYAKGYTERTGVPVKVITGGGSQDYNTVLKAEMASGREPDIFVIEGVSGYELWKDRIADQTGAEWTNTCTAPFMADGKVVGFPVAQEGYGLAYNKDILDKAGIDPATLINYDAYAAAFEKLDSMKAELGLDMVVSMVAGTTNNMTWVTGLHNFNAYLSVGLERGDSTIIDKMLKGEVDAERFHQYCQYVALLFKYSDKEMLLNGNQETQMVAFTSGKAAFYHQGNWMDPTIAAAGGINFNAAYAPHAFLKEDTDGILTDAAAWYVVNSKGNVDEAIAYLNALCGTDEGKEYMVEKCGMIPAFSNVEAKASDSTPLTKSVVEWVNSGKTYSWQQYKMWDGFGMGTLGAIYELLAAEAIDVDTFEAMMIDAIATRAAQ